MSDRMRLLVVAGLLLALSLALLIGGLHTHPMWRLHGKLVSPESVGNAGIGSDTPLVYVHDHIDELWGGIACAAAAVTVAMLGIALGRKSK